MGLKTGFVKYYKSKNMVFIEIRYFNKDNIDHYDLLMNFINSILKDRQVFIDTYGLDECVIDKNVLNSLATPNQKQQYHKKAFLKEVNSNCVKKGIFDTRYTIFYIFNQEYDFNKFLENNAVNKRKAFKDDLLVATISMGELQSVIIEISNKLDKEITKLLSKLNSLNYNIKKSLLYNI